MDPVTLATITSGVAVLASESAKGLAGEAGKDTWTRIKSLLRWGKDPAPAELAPAIAQQLAKDEQAARRIVELLQEHAGERTSIAGAIVGNVNAEKLIVITGQTVAGDFNITM
ncbi:MAG: hypothetical protein JO040_06180 [Gemmatimonadetes bacterium]|nr:hypothetical protein [Gemmatimonadota bacterium]